METVKNIFSRRSIRSYEDRGISEEDLKTILLAGMSGPTCANTREWEFIVVQDPEMLGKMADANGIYANPLRGAALGILICGNTQKAFDAAKDYWVVDGAIAGQNMILAAKDLGIGSVWLGTWPQMDRVQKQSELFDLPDYIIPHSVIAFGYSKQAEDESGTPYFDSECIHMEKW